MRRKKPEERRPCFPHKLSWNPSHGKGANDWLVTEKTFKIGNRARRPMTKDSSCKSDEAYTIHMNAGINFKLEEEEEGGGGGRKEGRKKLGILRTFNHDGHIRVKEEEEEGRKGGRKEERIWYFTHIQP